MRDKKAEQLISGRDEWSGRLPSTPGSVASNELVMIDLKLWDAKLDAPNTFPLSTHTHRSIVDIRFLGQAKPDSPEL